MNRARGFTLLELLVVMLIIGLFSGLSVAWLNGAPAPAVQALEQLAAQAQHQAALARHSGQPMGLRWTGKQPEFVRFEQQRWVAQPWRGVLADPAVSQLAGQPDATGGLYRPWRGECGKPAMAMGRRPPALAMVGQ